MENLGQRVNLDREEILAKMVRLVRKVPLAHQALMENVVHLARPVLVVSKYNMNLIYFVEF